MDRIRLIISDYDRTFTDETLYVGPELLNSIRRLRLKGVSFSIVSGRKFSFLMDIYNTMNGYIDSFVAENGCVGYFRGRKQVLCGQVHREKLLELLAGNGIPYDTGEVVISVHRKYEHALMDTLMVTGAPLHVIRNIDSLMVLPRDVSKATGIEWLISMHRLSAGSTACIGDAENDVIMRDHCAFLGAVSNALPSMKKVADYVCMQSFGDGLREFLDVIDNEYS